MQPSGSWPLFSSQFPPSISGQKVWSQQLGQALQIHCAMPSTHPGGRKPVSSPILKNTQTLVNGEQRSETKSICETQQCLHSSPSLSQSSAASSTELPLPSTFPLGRSSLIHGLGQKQRPSSQRQCRLSPLAAYQEN